MKLSILRPLAVIALGLAAAFSVVATDRADKAEAYLYTTVAGGGQHTCAITGTTGVKCWGRNKEGQIGDGTTTRRVYATDVSGLTSGVTALSTGAKHNCALVSGLAKCWGTNFFGEIGDGTSGADRLTAVSVCASGSGGVCSALSGVTAIGAGDQHTCAVVAGGVKCWGRNQSGQLGDGTTSNSVNPVQVSGLTSGATAVIATDGSTCALMSSGAVKCWGFNDQGQLGDGTYLNRLTPVDVSGLAGVSRLAGGDKHMCALLSAGTMKCWGWNIVGQLGDTTTNNGYTPVTVCAAGTGTSCGGSLTNVAEIAAGGAHTCALTSSPASVYCWGWDGFGQLSDGPSAPTFFDYKVKPTQVTGSVASTDLGPYPYAVLKIGAGAAHSCALLDPSGYIYCWGWNVEGQLGDGKTTDRPTWAADTDWDGCTDEREAQIATGTETSGGRRNAFSIWDFFDTPDSTNTTLSTPIAQVFTFYPNDPLTVTVGSASSFAPAPGTVFIDQEKFSYIAKTTTTITLNARMLDGTVAAQHNTGAAVMSNVRDRVVDSNDVARVQARYLTSGNPWLDPRLPPPATGYHTAFDRTSPGPNYWNLGAADGTINVVDILAVSQQVGHGC